MLHSLHLIRICVLLDDIHGELDSFRDRIRPPASKSTFNMKTNCCEFFVIQFLSGKVPSFFVDVTWKKIEG